MKVRIRFNDDRKILCGWMIYSGLNKHIIVRDAKFCIKNCEVIDGYLHGDLFPDEIGEGIMFLHNRNAGQFRKSHVDDSIVFVCFEHEYYKAFI